MSTAARLLLLSSFLVPAFAVASHAAVVPAAPAAPIEDAKAAFEAAIAAQPMDPAEVEKCAQAVLAENEKNGKAWFYLGYALHSQNKLDDAIEAHKKAAMFPEFKPVAQYNAGCAYALKGDTEAAFEWLGKAVKSGFNEAAQMKGDADLKSLRGDPRFADLMKLAAANAGGGRGGAMKVQPYVQKGKREFARITYFSPTNSSLVEVSYGPVAWKEEYAEQISSGNLDGKAWRLGNDFWTVFDTNVPVMVGENRLEPGDYYLTAMKKGDDYVVTFHAGNDARKQRLDAYQCAQLKGGVNVAAKHGEGDLADHLAIALSHADDDMTDATMTIRFGTHKLTVPMKVELEAKNDG